MIPVNLAMNCDLNSVYIACSQPYINCGNLLLKIFNLPSVAESNGSLPSGG